MVSYRKHRKYLVPEINVAPYIDVMLVMRFVAHYTELMQEFGSFRQRQLFATQ